MEILKTPIEGLLEIKAKTFPDERGWFREFFNKVKLRAEGVILPDFVQDNISFSKKGVVRGLHLQLQPHGQAKFVSVISGSVVDVVVDVRKGSPTFGQTYQILISNEKQNSFFIPEGFAHGFAALEDTWFIYKCSSHYHPQSETGIRWNDPYLKIDWPVKNPIVSQKDRDLPTFTQLVEKSLISPHA